MPNLGAVTFPITFLHGKENQFFDPEGSRETSEKMQPGLGEFLEIPEYAHMDLFMGENAGLRVYPQILERLLRH